MNSKLSPRAVSFALIASFFCSVLCITLLSSTSISRYREITRDNQSHAESFVPAKRLTTQFEREILNARIFFIYYVTIQKPGSLESGWKRFHQAEDRLNAMAVVVGEHEELRDLREPVAKLQADFQTYGVALDATLKMVQGGEVRGSHFDEQVKQWAADGAVMVGDAGTVETLCFRLGEANTVEILNSLHNGEVGAVIIFLLSLCSSLALTITLMRRLEISVRVKDSGTATVFGV